MYYKGSCTECGSFAPRILAGGATGTVIALFSKACYISFNGWILMLCGDMCPEVPFSVFIEDYETRFVKCGVDSGCGAVFENGALVSDGHFYLSVRNEALKAAGERRINCLAVDISCAVEEAVSALRTEGKGILKSLLTGEECRDPFFLKYRQLVPAFCEAAVRNDGDEVQKILEDSIGLGKGLTPSMDDFITGFLSCAALLDPQHGVIGRNVFKAAAEAAPKRTNAISAAFITAAAGCEPFAAVRDILERRPEAVSKLISAGSSSGSDMLCGLVYAAGIIADAAEI